ncbi:MAG TPA: DUF3140 domain-containing protein [Devosiaceae bacterium]|jgi:hypothetical protein
MTEDDKTDIRKRFAAAVNMEVPDLASWLKTEPSNAVGWPQDRAPGEESVGHASGRRIVKLLRTKNSELTEADYKHMRKVAGFVARHLKQRPAGDVSKTRWRYSLMNWGHDPLK